MTPPVYTVTITSVTRGWSYTTTHGDTPDPLEPVHLADGLRYSWQWQREEVPGQLEAPEFTFRLYAHTAADVPTIEKGDYLTLELAVGSGGPVIVQTPPFRVLSATVDLDDTAPYTATAEVTAQDPIEELTGVTVHQGMNDVNPNNSYWTIVAHRRWRPRFAELAYRIATSIGCPTWWLDGEGPAETVATPGPGGNLWRGLAEPERVTTPYAAGDGMPVYNYPHPVREAITRLLNSHLPDGKLHALVSGWWPTPGAYPPGWQKVGPVTAWSDLNNVVDAGGAIADPATSQRLYLVPAGRATDSTDLPLALVVEDGTITLEPVFPTPDGHSQIALNAAWCDLPARMRKARESGPPNVVRILGGDVYQGDSSVTSIVFRHDQPREYANETARQEDGTYARDIPTALDHGTAGGSYVASSTFSGVEAPLVAQGFLVDQSARDAWVWDAFTVVASRVPDAIAADLLPRLAPRTPGETDGDEQLLRHVVVYRPAASTRVADSPVTGFISKGALHLADGDLTAVLTLTPGDPVRSTPADAVTWDDAATEPWGFLPWTAMDSLISWGDLAYVNSTDAASTAVPDLVTANV